MLGWLENTQYSAWIRDQIWGWPLALTLHAFGTAVTVGFIIIISLRLLGLFETIPYGSLKRLFPVFWAAVVLQFLSGFALWMAKPTQYADDVAFLLKSLLVVVGIVLAIALQGTIAREADAWEQAKPAPSRATKSVVFAALVWCGVLVAGRQTAHLGSLL